MNKFCLCSLIFFAKAASAGSDIGYVYTQSVYSTSQKIKAGVQIFPNHKISTSFSATALDPGLNPDAATSVLKIAYRYKINSDISLTSELKKTNDTYFFEGTSASIQSTLKFYSIENENELSLDSSANLRFEMQTKNYTKDSAESYRNLNFTIGLDQDLPRGFSVGADYTQHSYNSSSVLTSAALDNQTTLNTDINSYALSWVKKSFSIYVDYANNFLSVGLGYSQDSSLLNSLSNSTSNYITTEIYTDIEILENITLSLTASSGKFETSTASATTTSLGLQYRF